MAESCSCNQLAPATGVPPGELGSWGLEGRGGRREGRSEASSRMVHSGSEAAFEPWEGVWSPPTHFPPSRSCCFWGVRRPSAQQHALTVEHLRCAKTQSHLTVETAEAKERASSASLGPVWASPPEAGADVIIRSLHPPASPYAETDGGGASVTPRPGRGCPGIEVGLAGRR